MSHLAAVYVSTSSDEFITESFLIMVLAYATSTIEAQRGFYNINKGFGFAILYTLATQMTGLGLAGICRRFLVYPATMIWPMILPNAALFHTLHDGKIRLDPASTNGWSIPRFRFFYSKIHRRHYRDTTNICSHRARWIVVVSSRTWLSVSGTLSSRMDHMDQASECNRKPDLRWISRLLYRRTFYDIHIGLDHDCRIFRKPSCGSLDGHCEYK